jgi:hypothetical protein
MPSDMETFKIPTPSQAAFAPLRLVALWRDRDEYGKCVKLAHIDRRKARRHPLVGDQSHKATLPTVRIHI